MSTAILAFKLEQERLLKCLQEANAFTEETAILLQDIHCRPTFVLRNLEREGVICMTFGRYYIDKIHLETYRGKERFLPKIALMIIVVFVGLVLLYLMLSYLFNTS